MSDSVQHISETCLNCGSPQVGKFCPECGQRAQPTKLPLREFLEDAVETLFNIDNRLFKSFSTLFLKPGKITREYLEGYRAKYLPPLRLYLTAGVVYFLLASVVKTDEMFFINLGDQESIDELNLATKLQYSLFFLVPVMAGFIQLLHKKRKAYFVEYLIFSIHLHTIWFVLFSIQFICIYFLNVMEQDFSSIPFLFVATVEALSQIVPLIYLLVTLKYSFGEGWIKAFFKSFVAIMFYLITLGLLVFTFMTLH